ncbi:unnamed protein product, partial [Mesorhabditis spiculigera]
MHYVPAISLELELFRNTDFFAKPDGASSIERGHTSLINLPRQSSLKYPGKSALGKQPLSAASPIQQPRFPMSVSFYEPSLAQDFDDFRDELRENKSRKIGPRMPVEVNWFSGSAPAIQIDVDAHQQKCSEGVHMSPGRNFDEPDSAYGRPAMIRIPRMYSSQSCKSLRATPSLTTLRDFDMGSGEYDDPCEFDCKSVVSTASTSKLKRKSSSAHIRTFLRSPDLAILLEKNLSPY